MTATDGTMALVAGVGASMSRKDNRSWIRFKWTNNDETQAASLILDAWAKLRARPRNLARAIQLYDALIRGDIDRFIELLNQFFPGFALALRLGNIRPAEPLARTPVAPLKIDTAKRSAEEMLEAAGDDFGFGDAF